MKNEKHPLCAVSRKISAIHCLWHAGGLLSAQCAYTVRFARTAGVYLHSCNDSSACMEKTDASLDCLGNYLLYATAAFCFLILLFSAVVFFPFYRYVLFSQYHTLSGKKLTIILILHRPAFPFFAKIYISFFKIFFMYSRYPSSSMRKSQLLSVKICFRFSVTISYILFAFF